MFVRCFSACCCAGIPPPLNPRQQPTGITHVAAPAKAAEKPDAIGNLIADAGKPKAAPAEAPAAKDVGGVAVVQIGAFSSQALADKEWSKAAAVAPGAMAGKGKRVTAFEKDGATLYRTAITGFASRDQAQSLCDRLQAAGGSCFVR